MNTHPRPHLNWAQKLACRLYKWTFHMDMEKSLRHMLWRGIILGRQAARKYQPSVCNCGVRLVEVRQGRYDCPQCSSIADTTTTRLTPLDNKTWSTIMEALHAPTPFEAEFKALHKTGESPLKTVQDMKLRRMGQHQ